MQDTLAPAPVANLEVYSTAGGVGLSWSNPSDTDYQGARIQRSSAVGAQRIYDGVAVFSGDKSQFLDTDIEYGKTYHYTLFSYDAVPNYSEGATISIVPGMHSIDSEDGFISECPFEAGTGGELENAMQDGTALRVGDDASDLQYRSILSFDTSVLPKQARFQSAALQLSLGASVGSPEDLGGSVATNDADETALRVGDDANDLQQISILSFDTSDLSSEVEITDAFLQVSLGEIQGDEIGLGVVTVDANSGGFNGNPALESAVFNAYSEATDFLNSAAIS